jgi:hypothetical protein
VKLDEGKLVTPLKCHTMNLKGIMVVKIHTSFGECSASDSRLVLQLGSALNKRLGRLQGN